MQKRSPSVLIVQEAGGQGYGLDRIVLPLSSLGGWAMIAVGVLTALHVIGVNIQPLLAVGGIGGIAIGFGAQAVTANAISGINLVLALHEPTNLYCTDMKRKAL